MFHRHRRSRLTSAAVSKQLQNNYQQFDNITSSSTSNLITNSHHENLILSVDSVDADSNNHQTLATQICTTTADGIQQVKSIIVCGFCIVASLIMC